MPGAFAHITMVNCLSETARLKKLPSAAAKAVLKNFKFCELGAVSPDYPYLVVGDHNAKNWANSMHHERTGEMIHAGIEYLKGSTGSALNKGIAWLLGYAAHVTTDVTIHPVVEMKVGPYKGNEKKHRICEMNQDSYIYQRLDLGGIGVGEHLDTGIAACSVNGDREQLDPDIVLLWRSMLQRVYPSQFASSSPDIHLWHRQFVSMVDNIAEEGQRLIPIARHVAVDCGLTYPERTDVDPEFIHNLEIPGGRSNYDAIFDRAIDNVTSVWEMVARGVFSGDQKYLAGIGHWNLDNGRNERDSLVFWS